jgi:hypothetical protein
MMTAPLSRTWIQLPQSKHGIDYSLKKRVDSSAKTGRLQLRTRDVHIKQPTCKSPFEILLEDLNQVIQCSNYLDGTALMYVREIFEPEDPEFDFITSKVNACQLTQEQVNRLRIMIIPEHREEILLAYLDYYERANSQPHAIETSTHVLKHFEGFKRRYSMTRDLKEKFDLLFGFSFAIKKYSLWMYRRERMRARGKMVAGLARHWRHLLRKHTPEQLGLDRDFSYPALLTFLNDFKKQTESVEMFGDPCIKFVYESGPAGMSFDEATVSTVTASTRSLSGRSSCTMGSF